MNIRVCAKCGKPISHVNGVGYCGECKDYTYPASIRTITVHTDRELKQAQIDILEYALATYEGCNEPNDLSDTEKEEAFKWNIESTITALKQSMEE